jgi:Helix-turn-helix domain
MAKDTLLKSDDYISTKEASQKYNYSMKAIRGWLRKHNIRSFKQGNKWYVHEPDIKTLVEAKKIL